MASGDDLLTGVKKWLGKTGYPLQMRVAREFASYIQDDDRSATWVTHGESWRNHATDVDHEADVVVDVSTATTIGVEIQLIWTLECKAAPNPWVVLGEDFNSWTNDFGSGASKTPFLRGAHVERELDNEQRSAIGTFLHSLPLPVLRHAAYGFSVVQAHTANNESPNPAYKAVRQAIRANAAVLSSMLGKDSIPQPIFVTAVPIVVTSAPLVGAALDASGDPEAIELRCAVVPVEIEESRYPHYCYIVQEAAFRDLAHEVMEACMRVERVRVLNGDLSKAW